MTQQIMARPKNKKFLTFTLTNMPRVSLNSSVHKNITGFRLTLVFTKHPS